jgi:hypothetical protein
MLAESHMLGEAIEDQLPKYYKHILMITVSGWDSIYNILQLQVNTYN